MSHSHSERRKLTRLPLRVPVRVQVPGTNATGVGETRDVSAGGLYFFTHHPLEIGQEVECVLLLPESLTQAPTPMFVACAGKVLRVEKDILSGKPGVAVEISSYDFSWRGQFIANLRNSQDA
jgi:hypothetical protein